MKSTPLKMKFVFKNILFIYNKGAQCSTYHSVYLKHSVIDFYIVEKLIENKYRVKGKSSIFFKWQIFILF